MEIGVSTACFYPKQTERIPKILKKLGVSCAEVFLNSQSEYAEDYCKSLREELDEAGVRVVSVHGFVAMHEPFLFSEYSRRAKDAFEIYKKVIRAAEILGAKYHTFHGARQEFFTEDFDYKSFGARMTELAETAGECGVGLAWENVCWCVSKNPEFIRRVLPFIQSENLGFTLDLKQAIRANFNFLEYAKIFFDRLWNVHISDASGASDCLLPGRGNVDFSAVFQALQAIGYTGDYIIEVYREAVEKQADLAESIQFLRKIAKNGDK